MGLARTALALVAAASVAFGLARVWPELGRQHDRYARLTPHDVELAGAIHEHLDPRAFARFRERVAGHDTYSLDADFVYRTFATYWLLPAVPSERPAVRLTWPDS